MMISVDDPSSNPILEDSSSIESTMTEISEAQKALELRKYDVKFPTPIYNCRYPAHARKGVGIRGPLDSDITTLGFSMHDCDYIAYSCCQETGSWKIWFFAPFDPLVGADHSNAYNENINSDGALDSYAENALWRLKASRSMISLMDRGTQYFLAGATKLDSPDHVNVDLSFDAEWFGCRAVANPGGLCESTVDLETDDEYPCFVVEDLASDERFRDLPVVNGEVASYRFYAGTPITTSLNVNIGSFFVFDEEPRPSGLTLQQKKYLHQSSKNVMKHLETKRDQAERRRVSMMSKGIADFLETTSNVTEKDITYSGRLARASSPTNSSSETTQSSLGGNGPRGADKSASEKTLDKIKLTLDHAADILRESLELAVGGVVFLDTAVGYNQVHVADAYDDKETDLGAELAEQRSRTTGNNEMEKVSKEMQKSYHSAPSLPRAHRPAPKEVLSYSSQVKPAKVLAMSAANVAEWQPSASVLDGKTLQTLINTYPQGNVWYIDEEGYFSSLDQANQKAKPKEESKPSAALGTGRPRSLSKPTAQKQQAEASLLVKVFEMARQIIFIPLWDASGDRWYSGCFVWSRSAVPVFTVDSEIGYLSAFTNSVMVEISRLDAIIANKMKSDFISSISHEFRSPLHGILASAEFLRESELDASQAEFVATIQNCGSTLLDTINHVLDYSKINSFQKSGGKGTISNELYQTSNIALLCEEIVNGMIAASEYQHTQFAGNSRSPGVAIRNDDHAHDHPIPHERAIEVILDFEQRDWNFMIQAGALRRVIMNIFGNAQKYTSSGFILVKLGVRDLVGERKSANNAEKQRMLVLNIIDSGRGMSAEYMERKLYTPFAQEDSFATGVGLGLSIVWSIVTQLGGKIQIRSDVGKGTDVEVVVPLDDENHRHERKSEGSTLKDNTMGGKNADSNMTAIRALAAGKTVVVWRNTLGGKNTKRNRNLAWNCLETYCSKWFGFNVISLNEEHKVPPKADLIIMEKQNRQGDSLALVSPSAESNKLLLIRDELSWHDERKSLSGREDHGNIWTPIGPHKLARTILALFQDSTTSSSNRQLLSTTKSSQNNNPSSHFRLPNGGMASTTAQSKYIEEMGQKSGLGELPHQNDTVASLVNVTRNAPASADIDASMQRLTINSPTAVSKAGTNSTTNNSRKPSIVKNNPQNPLRLLVVDDNDLNLQLLCRYLNKRKIDIVHRARDGLEALNAVKELAASTSGTNQYDIIFMDITMPVMDGFESTCAIREFERANEADIPNVRGNKTFIVALTGLASRRDRDKAEQCGVDDFMTKPVNFARIGELVSKLSDQKGLVEVEGSEPAGQST